MDTVMSTAHDLGSFCQEVLTLPLAPHIRGLLQEAGIRTVAELQAMALCDLAQEARLSASDADEIARRLPAESGQNLFGTCSAEQLQSAEQCAQRISTSCRSLDAMLGGGIETSRVTELCGVPGVGKTQLGLQLAVNVQVPAYCGGLGGEAVFIDTEGSFAVERVSDMAAAAVQAVEANTASTSGSADEASRTQFNLQHILNGIYYFRIDDYTQLLAVLDLLGPFLDQHRRVRLVIIDSIAFHFRQAFRDFAERARILTHVAQACMMLAEQRNIAVVYTNQVTTKTADAEGGGTSKLAPALGETWGHAASTRCVMHWQAAERLIHVLKSSSVPPTTVAYTITQDGVRSVD